MFPDKIVTHAGFLLPPNSEARFTNDLDFRTISRTNNLGFLEREPASSRRQVILPAALTRPLHGNVGTGSSNPK